MDEKVITAEEEPVESIEDMILSITDEPYPLWYILIAAALLGGWGIMCLISVCLKYNLCDVVKGFFGVQ